MSALKKFFGSKKSDTDQINEEKQKVTDALDLLTKKSAYLEKKVEDELAQAKRYGMKNKKLALKALQKKKAYESQLQKIDNSIMILENQIAMVDNAGMNLEVLKGMKAATSSLKTIHKDMKLDDVHKVMDDMQEQHDTAQEISGAISDVAAYGIDYDEDELLAELEELQGEELERGLLDVSEIPQLPSVPTDQLPAKREPEKESEKELEELMAWAE